MSVAPPAAAPPDPLHGSIPFAVLTEIGIIDQLSRARLEAALPDGLLAPHFAALNHLAQVGDGASPVDLARALQVAKGTMTNTLQRLEARGLVLLSPDPRDGRAKRVGLTDAGRAMRAAAATAALEGAAAIRAAVPDGEFAAALPFLRRLRAALDAARPR